MEIVMGRSRLLGWPLTAGDFDGRALVPRTGTHRESTAPGQHRGVGSGL